MRESFSELLCVGQVDAFVGGVGVSFRSEETESKNERVGVLLFKFSKEGDGTTHAVSSGVISVKEVAASLLNGFREPWHHVFHAPALSGVATLDSHNSVVGRVSRQLLYELGLSLGGVTRRWQSHGKFQ